MKHEITIKNTADLDRAAAEFLEKIGDRTLVAFFAPMGAGKTTFIKAICEELGVEDVITSPTFAIVNEYLGGRLPVYHFDMYRVSGWEDLYSTGFFDYLDMGGLLAVEWSENVEDAFDGTEISVSIEKLSE